MRTLPNYKVRAKRGQHVALAEMRGREVPVWNIGTSLYVKCKKVVGGVEDTEMRESRYSGEAASSSTSRPSGPPSRIEEPGDGEETDPEMPNLVRP